VTGNRMSLRVAAVRPSKLYVALYRGRRRAPRGHGTEFETMQEVIWDVALSARRVFLEIIDQATGPATSTSMKSSVQRRDHRRAVPRTHLSPQNVLNLNHRHESASTFRRPRGRLTVFDVRGRMVREIYNGPSRQDPRTCSGTASATWRRGRKRQYFYCLDSPLTLTRSMVLLSSQPPPIHARRDSALVC
jgi:hypothetical protein